MCGVLCAALCHCLVSCGLCQLMYCAMLCHMLCHAVQGCIAMKMLGWEDPFAAAIHTIRDKEVSFAARMAQIKGLNLALQ